MSSGRRPWLNAGVAVTVYGILALTFMMTMYALERRGPGYVLAFAFGCALSSVYGFLSGAWPFGVVELIWSGIAVRRWADGRGVVPAPPDRGRRPPGGTPGDMTE